VRGSFGSSSETEVFDGQPNAACYAWRAQRLPFNSKKRVIGTKIGARVAKGGRGWGKEDAKTRASNGEGDVGVIDGGHGREEGVRKVSASRPSGDGAAEASRVSSAQNAQEAAAAGEAET
jgi:hypothetical protein